MKRADIKILVVEDDSTLGLALKESLHRAGYSVRLATNPDESLNLIRQSDYKLAIIDCLLPKSNGVELAVQLKAAAGEDFKVILTSGIYREKLFVKEASQKTGALSFFIKPFDLNQLMNLVETTFAPLIEADLPPLLESLTTKELELQHRQKITQNLGSLHGFDLPLVYSILFGSGLTGRLTLTTTEGETSTLTFTKGKLAQVQIQDKKSYFGVLLVEMGFSTPEEIDHVLESPNLSPIGERLVATHSLSPHAIRLVLEEQMLIRLSKTVQDAFVEVSFTVEDRTDTNEMVLDRDRFSLLLWDWAASKLSVEWLQIFYSRWLDYHVEMGDRTQIQRRLARFPSGKESIAAVLRLIESQSSLGEVLESNVVPEQTLFPVLHFLLLEKWVHFGSRRSTGQDYARTLKRLQRLLAEAKSQNYFELLGVSQKAGDHEISRQYMDLAKQFHPDRVDPNAPPEIKSATAQYFAQISKAHEALKDRTRRMEYLREAREGSAEKVLHNESLFEQGQNYLKKGKYKLALDTFARLASDRVHRSDLQIYLAWAKLKVGAPDQKIEAFLNSISETLARVPPEDRHSAHFFFTKALFYMQIGNFEKAKTNFKHALVLDPQFVQARRELTNLRSRLKAGESNLDLGTVVTRIFSRRGRR